MFRNRAPGKLREVTIDFKPPLAFALMTSASNKRLWAKYNSFRNYRERAGAPRMRFLSLRRIWRWRRCEIG